MKKLAIFDLDGTLLDTIEDLAAGVNHALRRCGYPELPVEGFNFLIGNGVGSLLRRALPEDRRTEEEIARMKEAFIPYYNEHSCDLTKPYDGIPELLAALQGKGVKLAVASNKYHSATAELAARFFPGITFAAVMGQRDGVPVKPDPVIVNDILAATGIAPEDTIYIGDSGVDMQTARNAEVESVGVTWGFRPMEELVSNGAVHTVDKPSEILRLAGA